MKVLVTGGAGYIGSTISAALEENGHTPVVLDSLITGRRQFVLRSSTQRLWACRYIGRCGAGVSGGISLLHQRVQRP